LTQRPRQDTRGIDKRTILADFLATEKAVRLEADFFLWLLSQFLKKDDDE
jgi:hypothetical protein